jgi:anti-sigma-K factor RskA
MSLREIFHAELWSHPPSWGTLLFWAALIISAISAVIALAISTADFDNRQDDSDAPTP